MNAKPLAASAGNVQQLCERYGLQSDPFADAPDRFFEGGQRQQSLEYLRHLAIFGDLLLIVAGEPGVGRSRLLAEFCRENKSQLDFRLLAAEDCQSVSRLAQALWGLNGSSFTMPSDPATAIKAFFAADQWLDFSGKRWVLVMDDADQVPLNVLEALTLGSAESAGPKAPVALLVGSMRLADALQASFGGRLYRVTLRPLNRDESGEYIKRCLQWAGGDPSKILDGRRINEMYQRSEGYFDRLKQVAPEAILSRMGPTAALTTSAPRQKKSRQALVATSAVVLLGISYMIVSWQYQDTPEQEVTRSQPPSSSVPTEVERVRLAIDRVERNIRSGSTDPAPRLVGPVPERADGGEAGAALPANPPLLPESVGLSVQELLVAKLAEPVVLAPPEEVDVPEPETDESVAGKTNLRDGSGVAPTEATAAVADPDGFQPAFPSAFKDRLWVESIPAGSFTIQLLGGYSEDTAVQLVKRYPSVELLYVRSTYRGKPWFVVIHGIYPSRDLARVNVSKLPRRLRRDQPWIRETGGL